MNGYSTSHRSFSFEISLPDHLSYLKESNFIIKKVRLEFLYARIVKNISNDRVKNSLVTLSQTPHFQNVIGKRCVYEDYLKRFSSIPEHKMGLHFEALDALLNSRQRYLEDTFASNYIICEKVPSLFGHRLVILDGVQRACQLLHQEIETIPVAIVSNSDLKSLEQFDQYLADYKDDFLEWYTPLQLKGRVIQERTYPHFRDRPEFLTNRERGRSKWEYIIERNLPDIIGKSVCDIGCNSGLFSLFLAQRGARKVVGYDRGPSIFQPTNVELPSQNVVEQAYFVKNLHYLAGISRFDLDQVEFRVSDLNALDYSTLKFDFFFSCCVLYHFGDRFEEAIRAISSHIPDVLLQTNLGHNGRLAEYASVDYHCYLLEKYGYITRVDAPESYDYPVIVGTKR